MKRIACIAALLLSSGAALAADAPSTTGLWKIEGDVQGRPVNIMCSLTQADHKLSGNCTGALDGFTPHQITGKVKAQKAEFYFQAGFGGNPITLVVSGTMSEDGTRMEGSLDVEPMAVGGTFTGTREPVPSGTASADSAPSAIPPADNSSVAFRPSAAGTWKVELNFQGTSVKLTCVIAEANEQLSGNCTGEDEDKTPRALSGADSERGLSWHFDAEYEGQPIHVAMNATLNADGSKMDGTVSASPLDADGTFTATKQ